MSTTLGFVRNDWDLLKVVAAGDWVLVTNNSVEFRGRYRRIELHPGVVFLLPAVRGLEQVRLFEAALDHLERQPDLIIWPWTCRWMSRDAPRWPSTIFPDVE